jgi:hypothetical protein
MTGDVSISPEARCLVMTTEILRSMLYRRAALLPTCCHTGRSLLRIQKLFRFGSIVHCGLAC